MSDLTNSRLAATTTTTQIVELTDKAVCIQYGLSGKKALMDSARAYVTYHGAIEEWFEEMGMPQSTGYRYKSQLLKEGSFKYLQPKQKSDNPSTVRSRKHRASVANSHTEKMQQPDDSSSPLIHPEVLNHVTDVQPCDTSTSIGNRVRYVQSEMDSRSDRCDEDLVPVDTTNDGRVAADHAKVNSLIQQIESILERHYAPLDPGTFDGFHWTDFYEQFDSLRGRCEQYSREYRKLDKEHAEQGLSKAKLWVDSNFSTEGDRIGSDDEVLRLV